MKSNWDGFFSSVFLGRWFFFFSPGKSRDQPLAASAGLCRAWHWRAKAGWGAAISHLDYVLHPKWDFAPLRAARAVVIASLISSLPHAHCWSGTGAVSAPAELPWWLSKQSPHSASIMGWKLSACCWYPASLGWGCSAGNDAFGYAQEFFWGVLEIHLCCHLQIAGHSLLEKVLWAADVVYVPEHRHREALWVQRGAELTAPNALIGCAAVEYRLGTLLPRRRFPGLAAEGDTHTGQSREGF